MASVELQRLAKKFGGVAAVREVSIAVAPGEMFFMLGPSGCGKTTCLRIVAGFESPDAGEVLFDGKSILAVPPHRRRAGMVFQTYALFPHMTALQNVEYGLRFRGVPAAQRRKRAAEMLEVLRIGDLGARRPGQLSGGQQQRVALARALVVQPEVLLLDEPLSNLDTKLRAEVREEIRRIHARFRTTTLYVTHDQEEALSLADRVAVMRAGVVEQVGTPREVYERPANAFVAAFVGEANMFEGPTTNTSGGMIEVETPHGRLRATGAAGGLVTLCARPERTALAPAEGQGPWVGAVADAQFFGATVRVEVKMPNGDIIIARVPAAGAPAPGAAVRVEIGPEDLVALEG
jgi:putative spermidine/putrescine transport system ATP-binding protein